MTIVMKKGTLVTLMPVEISLLIPQKERNIINQSSNSMNIELRSFELLDILGVGAFGAVWKVRKIKTSDIYALKVIDTSQCTSQNFYDNLVNEKSILEVIEGDFVVQAYYSFSQDDCLFFVLEYLEGGSLGNILK